MSFAEVNGIRLYYEVHGKGPPVLMAHGVGSNHLHWWQQVPDFAKDFTVITYDARGFGFSTEDGQGPGKTPDDVVALLDHLKLDKVALVAQSMGGFTIGAVAARNPERVTALVLTGTPATWVTPHPQTPRVAEQAHKATNYKELIAVLARVDGFPEREPERLFLFEQTAQLNHQVDIARLRELGSIRTDPTAFLKAKVPMLLAAGEEDEPHVPVMHELKEMFPHAELEIVKGTGHLMFFERPQLYNNLVGGFLRKTLLG